MKFYTILFIVLNLVAFDSAFAQSFSKRGNKLVMHSSFLNGRDIEMKLGKLVERDSSGKKVRDFNLVISKKEGWGSTIKYPHSAESNLYSSTYTTGEKDAALSIAVFFGTIAQTTVSSFVPCSGCKGTTSGPCQNTRTLACKAPKSANTCRKGFLPCSSTVVVHKDILTIEFGVSWKFKSSDNKLFLEIDLETKQDPKVEQISLEDSGLLKIPTYGYIQSPEDSRYDVNVESKIVFDGKKTSISIEIPSFEEGQTFYLDDPDLL